jgi:hypothetical protein
MSSSTLNDIKNAPQTLSNGSCFQKAWCKWLAISGIILAVLIAISIIWCCVRCCCCGMSCCCGCFSCLNRCCPSGRGRKRSKHADPESDYRQPNPYMGYTPPSGPPTYQGPNTATFDVSNKNINADSLPAMPTWADGKVENSNDRGDVELSHITQPGQATGVIAAGRTSKGGYRELPNHDDMVDQPGSYRGTNSTHPYGSDLGAQRMMALVNTPYDPPRPQMQSDRFQAGAAAPAPYTRSSPPQQQQYAAYSPNLGDSSSDQARPPSLLQVGRKPVTGSSREV